MTLALALTERNEQESSQNEKADDATMTLTGSGAVVKTPLNLCAC
jgi:hypothetical protein